MTTNQETTESISPSRRKLWLTIGGVVAAGSLLSAGVQLAVSADDDTQAPATAPVTVSEPAAAQPEDPAQAADRVQQSLEALIADGGYPAPGALMSVRAADGSTQDHVAGVGDVEAGTPPPVDGHVRIGSNTKTFTAVVVLQLVEEGLVDLDAPIETYLPGVVRGEGIDATAITVRHLLQHTSGLGEYVTQIMGEDPAGHLDWQDTTVDPQTLLDGALTAPVLFAPGEGWSYSNSNYLLAGLVIEKVTGRSVAEEITTRIIEPVGLTETSFPEPGDRTLPEPYVHGYHPDVQGELADVTAWDPSMAWAAGQMISTPSDVNGFFAALIEGELLEPATLEEMQQTVPAVEFGEGVGYGLGLTSTRLTCGVVSWGHGGDIFGYHTVNGMTDDGRGAAVAVTHLPAAMEHVAAVDEVVDRAICGMSSDG